MGSLPGLRRQVRRPCFRVGKSNTGSSPNFADGDAVGSHFAIEGGVTDFVAGLEFPHGQKLGHFRFHAHVQTGRNAVALRGHDLGCREVLDRNMEKARVVERPIFCADGLDRECR